MTRRAPNEGSIYKTTDGKRWTGALDLGVVDGKRKRKYVYGQTQREVQLKLADLRRKHGLGIDLDRERQTVEAFLERWTEYKKTQVRPETLATYQVYITKHIVPAVGNVRLMRLRANQVQDMLDARIDLMTPRSVKAIRDILRAALNDAVRWGECERNPAAHAQPPAQVRKQVEALTVKQAETLLEHVQGHRMEALFRIALSLGLRRSEAGGLTWSDVDLAAKTLTVSQGLHRRPGGGLHLLPPKSASSRRTLPLPAFAVATLKAHKKTQLEARMLAANFWNDGGYVFTDAWGRPWDPDMVSHEFRDVAKKAGFPNMTFHHLRHAAATLLLAQKVPLKVVQGMLGHSSYGLTANTYTHVVPELEQGAASAMDKALGASRLTATVQPRRGRPRTRQSDEPGA